MNAQLTISLILLGALILFLWGYWRHDVVAFLALVIAVVLGIVPAESAFSGLGHPAVITVACVLVISRALQISGAIDVAARHTAGIASNPIANMAMLTIVGAVLSAFMNNVGALALMMPLALRTSKSPSQVLMPLSFGTILGGMMTEIGTPPNIIIAAYRKEVTGQGFELFDFAPVGLPVTLIGVMFLVLFGWRLIPSSRLTNKSPAELLEGAAYLTEAQITAGSKAIGKTIRQFERLVDNEALVVGLIRHEFRQVGRIRDKVLQEGDITILRTDSSTFQKLIEIAGMKLVGDATVSEETLRSDEIALQEFVVMPGSRVEWRSAREMHLTARFGINLLAIARQGERINERLGHARLRAGDVLLMQGEKDSLQETMTTLGCIPLAERGLRPIRKRKRLLPVAIFAIAITATTAGLLPVEISFSVAVIALVILNLISAREVYESIDWSVIILLGALIPLGEAFENTGVTSIIAHSILEVSAQIPIWAVLCLVMTITMALTNLLNNAATAVMMAPIAFGVASQTGSNPDPFLMATAIAASSAFLTPIGHQNNVLVMGPGGYRFGDYWRMGLPLQVLIIVLAVPLILIFWPL